MLRSTEFPRRMERLLEGAVALASERGQLCATSAPACVVGPETRFHQHRMRQVGEKVWDKGRSCVVCVHK